MNNYKLLGVDEDATLDEIKKKFRCLQLKLHPDKDNSYENNQKYSNICEAYETLSDETLRSQYDLSLEKGSITVINEKDKQSERNILNDMLDGLLTERSQNKNEAMPEILNKMIGHVMGNICNMDMKMDGNMGVFIEPIVKSVVIDYLDAYRGTVIPVSIEREITYINGDKIKKLNEKETIYVKILEGVDENEVITLEGKGNIYGKDKGDVKIVIYLENNDIYGRRGIDLIYKKKISLNEALCGFEFSLDHLNQKIYNITNYSRVIECGHEKRIPGLGFRREDSNVVGDLLICFKVVFPRNLSPDQLIELKKIL